MKFSISAVQTRYDSPLGRIIVAASEDKLLGVWFDGQRHQPDPSAWPIAPAQTVLKQATAQLTEYFAGRRTIFELPLDLSSGSIFQQSVWRALQKIPYGATRSYGALSTDIGRPTAVRAVGAAVGRNPFSIIVPCHRVLGSGGALTGYAGGLERKTALLQLEGGRR